MKTKLFFLSLSVALVFSSCAKKTVPPTNDTTTYDDSYTINGNGFVNAVYNVSSVSQQTCTYDANTNVTKIIMTGTSGDSITINYDIEFTGKSTGTYTLSPPNNVMTITTTPVSNPNGLQIYSANSGAKLTISTYGTSGGKITGTFSGSFNNTGNNYAFTNGTFSAAVQ